MEDHILLFLRIVIGCVFITSAVSKLNKMTEHIVTIRKYKILPPGTVRFFAFAETTVELAAAILFLIGFQLEASGVVLILLLGTYSTAIILNLFRGNTDINCGCGGLAGDKKLSWFQPIRNVLLTILILPVIWAGSGFFSLDAWLAASIDTLGWYTAISSLLLVLLYSTATSIIEIHGSLTKILKYYS